MNSEISQNTVAQPLISPERQQKYELITSLIKTQQQSIIVCGPSRIGKTTLLHHLAESKHQRQLWKFIQADQDLTLEKIVVQLLSEISTREERATSLKDANTAQVLKQQLAKISANGYSVVLIVEDVGMVKAGIVTRLFTFISQCQGLQLILSITPDDLFIKRATDYVIDESYVVEIPPLAEGQVLPFLTNYLEQHSTNKKIVELDQESCSDMYHRTKGIPGELIQDISGESIHSKHTNIVAKPGNLIWFAVLGMIGVVIWLGLTYIGYMNQSQAERDYIDLNNAPPPLAQLDTLPQQPELQSEARDEKNQQPISQFPTSEDILNSSLEKGLNSLAKVKPGESTNIPRAINRNVEYQKTRQISAIELTPEPVPDTQINRVQDTVVELKPVDSRYIELFQSVKGPHWILNQNKNSYTLQLMATHEQHVLQNYIKRLTNLQKHIAYYRMKREGKEWFGLVYGLFHSAESAKNAVKSLPGFLGKPYLIQIGTVQNRIQGTDID